jgi:S1-C subfamily serine protease
VDGKWGVIYARPENSPARPYNHNRLGAVFLPKDLKSDPLIAHVLPGTPAFEAGIRDGDVLRRVGDDDVTHWRAAGSSLHNINFWEKPAGTQLDLILQRDGRDFHALVTLRDLIGPSVKPAATP